MQTNKQKQQKTKPIPQKDKQKQKDKDKKQKDPKQQKTTTITSKPSNQKQLPKQGNKLKQKKQTKQIKQIKQTKQDKDKDKDKQKKKQQIKQNTLPISKKQQQQAIQIQIQLNLQTLSPTDPNITLTSPLTSFTIQQITLYQIYTNQQLTNKFIIKPVYISIQKQLQTEAKIQEKHQQQQKQQKLQGESKKQQRKLKSYVNAVFCTSNMKRYQQQYMNLSDQIVYQWIIDILYNLHPYNVNRCLRKTSQNTEIFNKFLKIHKANLYIPATPFLPYHIKRNKNFTWQNPLKLLPQAYIATQKQYIKQLNSCISIQQDILNKIKDYQDLQKQYMKIKYKDSYGDVCRIENVVEKINGKLEEFGRRVKDGGGVKEKEGCSGGELDGVVGQETVKWMMNQLNINVKSLPYIFYKASNCMFSPAIFWQKVGTTNKDDQIGQFFILEIQPTSTTHSNSTSKHPHKHPHSHPHKHLKHIAFYTTIFPQTPKTHLELTHSPEYIQDPKKTSKLLNLTQRSIHQLTDPSYAYTFNNNILLCIGKFDIILSAFNIRNLCYFPVSYGVDVNGVCGHAEGMCFGKGFGLREVYLCRFRK